MKTLRLIFGLLIASALASSAQPGVPGQMPGMDLTLMKLFGAHKAFSAKADMTVTSKSRMDDIAMTSDIAMLDGKMRTEVDMGGMKNKSMPPEALAQVKRMGTDRAVSIMMPAQRKNLMIFPNLKIYTSIPLPEPAAGSLTNAAAIEKTELGKETIDGHPCVKNKVIIAAENGKPREFTVWNATDLKDFPVQSETTEQSSTIRFKYRDIQFAKPDAKLFEPPAGFKSYPDMQTMMMSVMQKFIEENMPKPPQGAPPSQP